VGTKVTGLPVRSAARLATRSARASAAPSALLTAFWAFTMAAVAAATATTTATTTSAAIGSWPKSRFRDGPKDQTRNLEEKHRVCLANSSSCALAAGWFPLIAIADRDSEYPDQAATSLSDARLLVGTYARNFDAIKSGHFPRSNLFTPAVVPISDKVSPTRGGPLKTVK
jgi:hypothetical protein